MVPPKNAFLSLRLPIFGSSYYQCFLYFGIAPAGTLSVVVAQRKFEIFASLSQNFASSGSVQVVICSAAISGKIFWWKLSNQLIACEVRDRFLSTQSLLQISSSFFLANQYRLVTKSLLRSFKGLSD